MNEALETVTALLGKVTGGQTYADGYPASRKALRDHYRGWCKGIQAGEAQQVLPLGSPERAEEIRKCGPYNGQ